MTAAEPNRSRTSSSAASSAPSPWPSNGSVSWTAPSSSRFADGDPDERQPVLFDHRHRRRAAALAPWRGSSRCARSRAAACANGWPGRSRRSAAAARRCGPTRPASRMRRVTRSTSADELGVDARPATAAAGRARAASRSSAGAGRPAPAADRGCGRARGGAGRTPGPSIATSAASGSRATSPTVVMPRSCSFAAVTAPDAPQPLDRERMEEGELPVGRHDEQAVGLGDPARHLGEELRPRHADRDRQADLFEDVPAQPHRDLGRACRRPAAARRRRGTPRRSTAPRPSGVVSLEDLERRPCSPRCTPPSAARRRSRAGTAAAPAHRPSPCGRRTPSPRSSRRARPRRPTITGRPRKPGVVTLLDGRVEGVEVGVQDRRCVRTRTHVRTRVHRAVACPHGRAAIRAVGG